MPDAARAWVGGECGGQRPPRPLAVAALRGRSIGLCLLGCVLLTQSRWQAPHGRGGLGDGRSSGAAPLAYDWPLRFSVLGRPRTVISARSCVKARSAPPAGSPP